MTIPMTIPANPAKKNYNPLTCCLEAPYPFSKNPADSIPAWFKQYSITLLRIVISEDDRDETGVQPTVYQVREDYVDVECAATGGGISAALKNEQWTEDQIATFYTDKEPAASTQDGVLFARNIFVIESVEPIGMVPVSWRIHAVRRAAPVEVIQNLSKSALDIRNQRGGY